MKKRSALCAVTLLAFAIAAFGVLAEGVAYGTATIDDYGRADTGSANAGYWNVSGRGATVVHQATVSIGAEFLSGGWSEAESVGSQLESRRFTEGIDTLRRSLETDLPGTLFILR